VRPLELVKRIVSLGTSLRRGGEATSSSALDAALRAVEGTTAMMRHVRSGPLPPATRVERIALTVAAAQLRLVATGLGLSDARPAGAPPGEAREEAPEVDRGFVSPADRALLHDAKEARVRAALGALVAETLALVDEVLATSPELRGGSKGGALPPGA
jgi:hypothetical protein